MFCHEGPWNYVQQRIWLINMKTGDFWPCFRQTEDDCVGHEFWSQKGDIIFDNRRVESIVRNLSDADYWDGGIVPNCGAMVLELKDGKLAIEKVIDLINQTETVVGLGTHKPRR